MQVFAYGSLLWRPGFVPLSQEKATARGWRRCWSVQSTVHRGTADLPGFVLGLVPGGSCTGILYTVAPGEAFEIEAYLDRRELCEKGYRKTMLEVETSEGVRSAVSYVSEAAASEKAIQAILKAEGVAGSNLDYALRTIEAVEALVGSVTAEEVGMSRVGLEAILAANAARACGAAKPSF